MKVTRRQAKEIQGLKRLRDDEIDLTDIPPLQNWTDAVSGCGLTGDLGGGEGRRYSVVTVREGFRVLGAPYDGWTAHYPRGSVLARRLRVGHYGSAEMPRRALDAIPHEEEVLVKEEG